MLLLAISVGLVDVVSAQNNRDGIKNRGNKNAGQGSALTTSSSSAAATATASSTAASGTNNNNNNAAARNGATNNNSNTGDLALNPNNVQTGSQSDGLAKAEAGQAASATYVVSA